MQASPPSAAAIRDTSLTRAGVGQGLEHRGEAFGGGGVEHAAGQR